MASELGHAQCWNGGEEPLTVLLWRTACVDVGLSLLEQGAAEGESPSLNLLSCSNGVPSKSRVLWDWSAIWW